MIITIYVRNSNLKEIDAEPLVWLKQAYDSVA
jgi:hypothetical protein